jgi:hypothetical protein
MTRALTLIRNFFVSSMREVATEVTEKMKKRQMNDTAQYARFRVNAPLLRDIVDEIEKRCDHEEYIPNVRQQASGFANAGGIVDIFPYLTNVTPVLLPSVRKCFCQ